MPGHYEQRDGGGLTREEIISHLQTQHNEDMATDRILARLEAHIKRSAAAAAEKELNGQQDKPAAAAAAALSVPLPHNQLTFILLLLVNLLLQ